jgi:peptidoglycan biosynthesis protein MviN/MurJ (putative lipid II flippase)
MGLFLLLAAVRFIYREKYAQAFLKYPAASRQRVIKYDKIYVLIFKISLWPVVLVSVLMPLASFLYFREEFIITAICMVLFSIVIFQEYRFRKWFVDYLETHGPETLGNQDPGPAH